jgi:hypothetical protein
MICRRLNAFHRSVDRAHLLSRDAHSKCRLDAFPGQRSYDDVWKPGFEGQEQVQDSDLERVTYGLVGIAGECDRVERTGVSVDAVVGLDDEEALLDIFLGRQQERRGRGGEGGNGSSGIIAAGGALCDGLGRGHGRVESLPSADRSAHSRTGLRGPEAGFLTGSASSRPVLCQQL